MMDSTVIQEIANQLGMAVDQAGQFVTEQLPAFAGLKVVQSAIPLAIACALFFVFAIVSLVALAVCVKKVRKTREEGRPKSWFYCCNYEDWMSFYVFSIAGIVALFLLLLAIIMTGFDLPKIIGWSNYPEAMLIDMALKAVG